MSTLHDSQIPSSSTSDAPSRPPGSRSARQSLVALALVPVGIAGTWLVGAVLTSLMGLPFVSGYGDHPRTLAQNVGLMAAGYAVGLTAPVASVVLAVRASRAGHPRGTLLVVGTSIVLALMTVLPLVDLLLLPLLA